MREVLPYIHDVLPIRLARHLVPNPQWDLSLWMALPEISKATPADHPHAGLVSQIAKSIVRSTGDAFATHEGSLPLDINERGREG
jgi:hypothetical protein